MIVEKRLLLFTSGGSSGWCAVEIVLIGGMMVYGFWNLDLLLMVFSMSDNQSYWSWAPINKGVVPMVAGWSSRRHNDWEATIDVHRW